MKRKKMLKFLIITTCLILIILSISSVSLYIKHRIKLNKESENFSPPGSLVTVNNNEFHIFSQGDGDNTMVFLSGHGTSSPTLDFKPLWREFVDDYRIVIVEKAGYGWSDSTNSPRDIDTILEETRSMLKLAGETSPYILFPHSMSGLEAIYWAQEYPSEVIAIIGLDPLIPSNVSLLPHISNLQLKVMALVSRIGLSRVMPKEDLSINLPLLDSDILTDEEKDEYIAIFYKSLLTKNMLEEMNFLKENATTVNEISKPIDVPMYLLISNEQDQMIPGWKDNLIEYISTFSFARYKELTKGHFVHHEASDIISEEVRSFLEEVQK